MSHYSKIFHKVPIQVPNKSGFDMSHERLFTAPVGTLVPALVDELLPGDTVSLGVSSQIQLPPMATDFYGRVHAEYNAFFVPNRLLYGGWKELITHPTNGDNWPGTTTSLQKAKYLPKLTIPYTDYGPGSLSDYLGMKRHPRQSTASVVVKNPLPYLAYHKIYDDWYRDSRIQMPVFQKANTSSTGDVSQLPYRTFYGTSPVTFTAASEHNLADGVKIYSLRQRNYSRDYFTNATPKPQAGDESSLSFAVDVSTPGSESGSFSIASLRAANSLQQWMEINNIAGERYPDQIRAQFGVIPADACMDRAVYLGTSRVSVYNKSVYQDVNSASSGQTSTQNPFSTVGAKYASPIGVGDGSLVDHFEAKEHGFLFVMFSLVPDSYYGTGSRRMFERSSMMDFAFPMLAGVGDQEILATEISEVGLASGTFGYSQRYSEYKFIPDSVHGLLRDGESLEAFALKRSVNQLSPVISSSFLQIPTTALDDVAAVASGVSTYGCWVDLYNSYKKSSTLPAYSIPTLGDMKDTHTEIVDNGGRRL